MDNKENKLNISNIFTKYKKKSKQFPFNVKNFELGEIKYIPSVSKEWKNSIYTFNPNVLKNLPIYDININSLIQSYFYSLFKYSSINIKYKPRFRKRYAMNKIFVSKAEVKHTNSIALLTLYTYNREKISLLKKIKYLKKSSYIRIFKRIRRLVVGAKGVSSKNKKLFKIFSPNLYNKFLKRLFFKELILFRRYKLRFNLNKYKFEEKLLYILSSLIGKFYNKKVEFNIVNLKSLILNSDLFTKMLTIKFRKKKIKVMRMMKIILNRAKLPRVNRIIEKSPIVKSVDFNLLENKYKDLNIYSAIKNKNLDELLNKIYPNFEEKDLKRGLSNPLASKPYNKIHAIIFNSIKYKNMGGVRLEISGRLTKRYRADRALYKVRWKGGLKNIDSSYKGLSSVDKRGYLKPNVEYSIFTSRRRIGSFAVKGWVSGK